MAHALKQFSFDSYYHCKNAKCYERVNTPRFERSNSTSLVAADKVSFTLPWCCLLINLSHKLMMFDHLFLEKNNNQSNEATRLSVFPPNMLKGFANNIMEL